MRILFFAVFTLVAASSAQAVMACNFVDHQICPGQTMVEPKEKFCWFEAEPVSPKAFKCPDRSARSDWPANRFDDEEDAVSPPPFKVIRP